MIRGNWSEQGVLSVTAQNARFVLSLIPQTCEHGGMLRFGSDILPNTPVTYLAFRLAFQSTYERILLARQIESLDANFGYLTEVPFLLGVAPQVQLDILATTWNRHVSPRNYDAGIVDECVVYAACESAASLIENEPYLLPEFLHEGPREFDLSSDAALTAQLRSLHTTVASDDDFLLISQFEDLAPDEAAQLKARFGLDLQRLDQLFELLGRWHVSPQFIANLEHLLGDRELTRVANVFPVQQPSE